jgi:hypothetical protein
MFAFGGTTELLREKSDVRWVPKTDIQVMAKTSIPET